MTRATFLAAAFALIMPAAASAQVGELPMPVAAQPSANQKTGILSKVGIDQKIGQQLPLNTVFTDETGKTVRLGDYFGSRPVVMALVYYDCPMLCTYVLNGMTGSLKTLSFEAGKDFDVVAISIDPKENYRLAEAKKAVYVKNYGRPGTAAGWHFLTGSDASIHAVADALGFHYAYDSNLQQYAHGAAIYVATPKGIVARYFLGLDYAPRDLRLALVEASNNTLGSIGDQVLLLCYQYDPMTGKYGAATLLAVRIGFIATVGCLLTFIVVSLRRERRNGQTEAAHRI
ncbi:MAG: SCO family protein [Vicinamibacterales bacterium]